MRRVGEKLVNKHKRRNQFICKQKQLNSKLNSGHITTIWQFFSHLIINLPYDPVIFRYPVKRNENIYPYKDLHTNAFSSFFKDSDADRLQARLLPEWSLELWMCPSITFLSVFL